MEAANTKLETPTNVALASSTVSAAPNSTVRLSWTSVPNAGSYKVYLDGNLVKTLTTAYYDIPKKASSAGDYTVVAVPSNAASYSESNASSAVTLTVNKTSLPTPTVTISPLDIASGGSTTATFSNYSSLSSYISGGYATLTRGTRAYEATGGSFVTNTAVTSTTGSETLSPTSSIQYGYYMAVTTAGSEYYTQSGNSSFYDVFVAVPTYKIAGDLAGTAWNYNEGIAFSNYTSDGIFYFVSSSQSSGDHYFSFYDSSGNQYSGDNNDSDFTITLGEDNKYSIVQNTHSKAFKVSGSGVFMVFYDSVNSEMWVTQNTWAITPHVYYQSFNLVTDSYNSAVEGTTGGTISPDSETLVTKNSSQRLTASPASGYSFVGWYKSTTFTNANLISASNPYDYTPSASGDYYALFKQNEPAHYTLSVASVANATVTATYNGTTLQEGSGTKSVPVGATVSYTITPANGYKIDSTTPSGLSSGSGTFTMPSSNTAVSASLSKITYNLTPRVTINSSTVTTSYGTLKFYSDSACTSEITTSQVGNTFYAKYTPPTTNSAYYTSGTFSVYSGTGLSGPTNQATNVKKFVMGYSNATIAVNVVATTPSLTCAAMSGDVYAGESFTYTGASVSPAVNSTLTLSYKLSSGSYQSSNTFTAPTTAGTYTLTVKASNKPSGINTAAESTGDVTITVKYRQQSVNYYVDMHNNDMTGKTVTISVASNMSGTTVLKDNDGEYCTKNLTKQGSSSVYFAAINTPVTKSGDNYNDVYIKVEYNGGTYVKNLDSSLVPTLVTNKEMWLEAENEASSPLTFTYGNRTTPTVQNGYRRIYLAKPYSWQDDDPDKWENIGIYHWGNYTDIGWNKGIKMHHLGYSGTGENDYHYYYADIPKALDSTGTTVVTNGTGNKVSNIIFQGWGSNTSAGDYSKAQTGNIENIPDSANFYILSEEDGAYVGTKSEDDAVIPNYTRYVSSVTLNKTESKEAKIAPTYTGKITYTSKNTSIVTVDSDGTIHPHARGTTKITVNIYGTIDDIIKDHVDEAHKEYLTYDVNVTVRDPEQFNGFEIMSLESKTYTVNIPVVNNNQPGYFDMNNVVMTVEGIKGVASSTTSAIITTTATTVVSGVGTMPTAFTVKYAKANTYFAGYDEINIIGKVTTKSIKLSNTQRYGHDHWTEDGITKSFTTSRVINNGIETATTNGIPFDDTKETYSAVFVPYDYVDVTFTFTYYEYKPKVDEDGMINYPYDANYAGTEDRTSASFDASTHTLRTVTVQNYEVRGKTASDVQPSDLVVPALTAIGALPGNNYYSYSIAAGNISISNRNTSGYTANAAVNMTHSVKEYRVYLNGELKPRNVQGDSRKTYYYQEYAELTVNTASDWYAVESRYSNDTTNAPLLATGVNSYKFRVKGSDTDNNTYLRTTDATNPHGNDFLRSEVDFSHYEVTHQGSTPTSMKEYLMQNFYIADFFSPAEVLDPSSNNGQGNLPYDDAQFVGGGVVYYSMNGVTENSQGTPFANAVSAGYVDGSTGKINEDAVKEMLKTNIEAQYAKDSIAGTAGEETAMKVAYGTEIAAKKNVEGGFNTGIIYRYLPLNQYKRDTQGVLLNPDEDGNYAYDVNTNTFRYSNTLQSYQYVYASGNENKETNAGKNMRLYSYYVYSYVAYNQETNVPETKYEIVLSDNYSDASTYWNGNTGN